MAKRALISTANKAGVVEFAQVLVELGFKIVSTGGTAQALAQAGVPAIPVSAVTGFPEILGGRVKTLHPLIHGGILARRSPAQVQELALHGIEFIDLVAVNLYPFREAVAQGVGLAEAVEQIDIGGPALVRAAAKNFERVTVVVNPGRYEEVLAELKEHGQVSDELRRRLACEAFAHTAQYDAAIAAYLSGEECYPFSPVHQVQELRYGENPAQRAWLYRSTDSAGGLAAGRQLQGKELSYNNWMDMDAAWAAVREFAVPACVIVKHTNPCGAAVGTDLAEAFAKALESDPVSAFGGIVACNREVDAAAAAAMAGHFFEVVVAPGFSDEAKSVFARKRNLRLVEASLTEGVQSPAKHIRTIDGGYLVQDWDVGTIPPEQWQTVTAAVPAAADLEELEFAWKVVKHVKSNAIVVAKGGQVLGVGAGQMNRVGAARIALEQAGAKANGAYLASDAFFPFADTVEAAAAAGIRAIVQPGGSVRDAESIAAADKAGLIMVFTGRRHFKH